MKNTEKKQPLVQVKNLCKYFEISRKETLKAVDDLTFDIYKGETVSLVGESGCGKSTFLRSLNLLEVPTGGHIYFEGTDITDPKTDIDKHRQKMGMVFQQFNLFNNMDVMHNLIAAPTRIKGMSQEEAQDKALSLLSKVGLADRADAYPSQLSGGQKQRIAIVRSLMMDPEVMLFDEPTSALDAENRTLLLELLEKQRETAGILFISHDVAALRTLCGTVHVMEHGMLTEQGTIQELLEHPKQAWTKEYAEANRPASREGWTWTD